VETKNSKPKTKQMAWRSEPKIKMEILLHLRRLRVMLSVFNLGRRRRVS
jgi:hypothetical protein